MPFKSGFSQLITSTQFYIFGRRKFGRSGFESAAKSYGKKDLLGVKPEHVDVKFNPSLNLNGKVYIITGANSGVGYQITKFLAMHGATTYMVCRNKTKADKAKKQILDECENETASSREEKNKNMSSSSVSKPDIRLLIADVSLESDVRRVWKDFLADSSKSPSALLSSTEKEEEEKSEDVSTSSTAASPRLDGLVCNAGALLNKLNATSEGVEVTLAAHLLFGTYLFGSLAMPVLKSCPDGGRLIAVSSGGMYNTKWPGIDEAASNSARFSRKYDGQFSYACAKRGQVLLCQRWGEEAEGTNLRVVSCHPGWTATPGVDKAYGESKKYLGNMRTPWQGAEGIAWLCIAQSKKIKNGAFYLDRKPQTKHVSGWFFTQGWHTWNTEKEIDNFMKSMKTWSNASTRPKSDLVLPKEEVDEKKNSGTSKM